MKKLKSFSARQAARLTDRSHQTVCDWITRGELPARKVGRQWFIMRHDLAEFLGGDAVLKRLEGIKDE